MAALLFAPAPPQPFRAEYDPQTFPAAAVETLRGDPAARIFTYDAWGGYLIYRLYPRTRVFVDGRSDFYGADFSEKYLDVLNVKYDWEKTLGRFGVNTILLPTSRSAGRSAEGIRPLARGLRRRRRGGVPVRGEGRGPDHFRYRWR